MAPALHPLHLLCEQTLRNVYLLRFSFGAAFRLERSEIMMRLFRARLSVAALGLATLLWSAAPADVLARGGGRGSRGGRRSGGGGYGYGGYGNGGYGNRGYGYNGYGNRGYGYGGYGYGGYGMGGYGMGGYGMGSLLGGMGMGGMGMMGMGGMGMMGMGGMGMMGMGGMGMRGGGGGGGGGSGNSYGSGYYNPQSPGTQPARLTVSVPPNADVYLNGTKTQQTGTARQFVTPPLEPGDYQYDIHATWLANGQWQSQDRQVTVHPGDNLNVDFRNNVPQH
jgi:uncharacterized protein (TIGR03000 family)